MTDYWHSPKDEFGYDELEVDGMNLTLLGHGLAPRTARKWFRRKGYRWTDLKKGVFKDGHERSDVVAYRNDFFLRHWQQHSGQLSFGGHILVLTRTRLPPFTPKAFRPVPVLGFR